MRTILISVLSVILLASCGHKKEETFKVQVMEISDWILSQGCDSAGLSHAYRCKGPEGEFDMVFCVEIVGDDTILKIQGKKYNSQNEMRSAQVNCGNGKIKIDQTISAKKATKNKDKIMSATNYFYSQYSDYWLERK